MKITSIAFSVLALASSVSAETVKIKVTQDTWVGASEAGTVLQNSSPNALRIATPGNPVAHQYNRRAIFGFDLSSVDLKNVSSVTFTATTSKGINRAYDRGITLRAYLVSNAIADSFLQSTATGVSLMTAGFYKGGNVLDNRVAGVSIGDYTTSGSASEQTVNFEFSAEAIADLKIDSNQFATIIVENRTGSNVAYNPIAGANAGFSFQSLETPDGTPAVLTVEVGAGSQDSSLITVGGIRIGLK